MNNEQLGPQRKRRTVLAGAAGIIALSVGLAACGSSSVSAPTSSSTTPSSSSASGSKSSPSGSKASTASSGKKITVGVSVPQTVDPYFIAITDYFQREAAANGMKVLTANANGDVATQINQIETFVSEGVKAIAIDSINDQTIAPAIKDANNAGIPVFAIDTQPYAKSLATLHASVVSTVETNNYECGVNIGKEMLKWLGNRKAVVGRVILPLAQSTALRREGFRNTVKSDPNLKVVATVNGEAAYDTALTATSQMLQGHPDINVVFGDNGPVGVGATRAVVGAGLTGKVHVFANATVVPADQYIEQGNVFVAGSTQFPAIEAATTAYDINAYLHGDKKIASLIETPCLPVTHANASKVTAYNQREFTYNAPIQIVKDGSIYQVGSNGSLTKITLP